MWTVSTNTYTEESSVRVLEGCFENCWILDFVWGEEATCDWTRAEECRNGGREQDSMRERHVSKSVTDGGRVIELFRDIAELLRGMRGFPSEKGRRQAAVCSVLAQARRSAHDAVGEWGEGDGCGDGMWARGIGHHWTTFMACGQKDVWRGVQRGCGEVLAGARVRGVRYESAQELVIVTPRILTCFVLFCFVVRRNGAFDEYTCRTGVVWRFISYWLREFGGPVLS